MCVELTKASYTYVGNNVPCSVIFNLKATLYAVFLEYSISVSK